MQFSCLNSAQSLLAAVVSAPGTRLLPAVKSITICIKKEKQGGGGVAE
jgi:hypothetical protein